MSSDVRMYRDYVLSFPSPVADDYGIVIKNDDTDNTGLRIVFNIVVNSFNNESLSSTGNMCNFVISIYNLSSNIRNLLESGDYSTVSLSAGYRKFVNTSTITENTNVEDIRTTAPILINGDVYNAVSYRQGADIITTVVGITNSSLLNQEIDENDLNRFAKSKVSTSAVVSRKDVFLYYINKYMEQADLTINAGDNLNGFDLVNRSNSEPEFKGISFSKGTTLVSALTSIVGGSRVWYIDNTNTLFVKGAPNTSTNQPSFSASEITTVEQSTGLLGVPILSPAGTVTGKSLLNPRITPMSVVTVKSNGGFRQASSTYFQSLGLSNPVEITAVVMQVTLSGDSRGGEWVTQFTTLPPDYVRIL